MRFDECPGFRLPAGVHFLTEHTYCANCGGVAQKHIYGPDCDMTKSAAEKSTKRGHP